LVPPRAEIRCKAKIHEAITSVVEKKSGELICGLRAPPRLSVDTRRKESFRREVSLIPVNSPVDLDRGELTARMYQRKVQLG
jgi:hypothetical protein